MVDSSDKIYEKLFLHTSMSQNVSVFVSGSERAGTSWCALNTAYALSLKKKRVLFIDANGNFSNVDTMLLFPQQSYLGNYFRGNKTLPQLVFPFKNKNFHILSAKAGNTYINELPLGRLSLFVEDLAILAQNYDHIIIDLGCGISEKKWGLCQIADNILIMCTEDKTDLINTFELVSVLNKMHLKANYNLIINRVNSFEDGYKVYERLNRAIEQNNFKCPRLLGIVRQDTRIRDTIRNKEILLTRYPASEAALDVFSLVKKLTQGT